MFDIGFSEIVVCAIVALIVIGPERMPETVRTVGLWIGRLKRSLRETRVEIERQMGVDDIRRQLHNEDIMRSIENVRKDMNAFTEQTQIDLTSGPHVYPHEPELPDHAHMHENNPPEGDTQPLDQEPEIITSSAPGPKLSPPIHNTKKP